MRYLLSIIVVLITVVGCSTDTETMKISGHVKGLKKGVILLQKFEDTVLVTIDSVIINGKSDFNFSEKVESPEIHYLYVRLKDGSLHDDRITFFGENGDLNIQANLENFGSSAKISGSKNDSLLKAYDKLKQRFVSNNLDLIQQRLNLKADASDSVANDLDRRQRALISNQYFSTINFAMNHSDYEIAPFLVLSEAYDASIKYLDTVYNGLSPKIKDSKYGKELESFIANRKEAETTKER